MKLLSFPRIFFPVLFLASLFLFAGQSLQSAKADNESCLDNYERGNYAKAIEECTPLADQGDKIAAYAVGMIYGKGIGGYDDVQKAIPYLEVAASQGMGNAAYFLGTLHLTGETMPPNYKIAAKWLPIAVSHGSIPAHDALAGLYMYGLGGLPKDQKKGFDLYLKAAEGGFAGSMFRVATMYEYGVSVPINKQEALRWYTASADAGYPAAQSYLKTSRGIALQGPGEDGGPRPLPPQQITVQKGLPQMIPPSAGFTPEFKALYDRPESENQEVAAFLKSNIRELMTPYIYELSRRMADIDEDEAIMWFQVAQIRAFYDVKRCTDRTAMGGLVPWSSLVGKAATIVFQDSERAKKATEAAMELEQTFPEDTSPIWICRHGMAAMRASMEGREYENWHFPESEWPRIREDARAEFLKVFDKTDSD